MHNIEYQKKKMFFFNDWWDLVLYLKNNKHDKYEKLAAPMTQEEQNFKVLYQTSEL